MELNSRKRELTQISIDIITAYTITVIVAFLFSKNAEKHIILRTSYYIINAHTYLKGIFYLHNQSGVSMLVKSIVI